MLGASPAGTSPRSELSEHMTEGVSQESGMCSGCTWSPPLLDEALVSRSLCVRELVDRPAVPIGITQRGNFASNRSESGAGRTMPRMSGQ